MYRAEKNERIILRKIKKPELRECSKGESRQYGKKSDKKLNS